MPMKFFMDTHDRASGTFPAHELTEEEFHANFDALDAAAEPFGVFGHAAHVNLGDGKAFCLMSGPDEDAIRKAHAAIDFPYDSITEVRRVTGADLRKRHAVDAKARSVDAPQGREARRKG